MLAGIALKSGQIQKHMKIEFLFIKVRYLHCLPFGFGFLNGTTSARMAVPKIKDRGEYFRNLGMNVLNETGKTLNIEIYRKVRNTTIQMHWMRVVEHVHYYDNLK